MLVNLLNPKETITVGNDGQATLSAPNRGYSIWLGSQNGNMKYPL